MNSINNNSKLTMEESAAKGPEHAAIIRDN